MSGLRVVHYLNQFFAGVGSEEKADTPPGRKESLAGPSLALQQALGETGQVVATVYCGDNYAAEREGAVDEVVDLIAREQPDVLIAGPAFGAGRYGLACGEVCARAQEHLGVTAVGGMHADNAAAELYCSKVYLASTRESAAGMGEAIKTMARLALKLHAKEQLGSPREEGYLPMGRRVHFFAEQTAARRAVDMLLRRAGGLPFTTEWELPKYNRVAPAPPLRDLSTARLAVVTTGGLVPRGNPDRLEASYPTRWLKYSISDVHQLDPGRWQSIHGGYDTTNVNEDPNRLVPLDVLRALEEQGYVGKLHDQLYTTAAPGSTVPNMRRLGQEIARELKAAQVDGVILTAT